MGGWVKLHRELMDKAIWTESTPEQKAILITLLMMANHQEKEWEWKGQRYAAKPGQFVTSLQKIQEKCGSGISIQNIRTALKRFEKLGFLTDESTNKNRLITIVNWDIYQREDDELTSTPTSNQQATNKQLTTNKNDKNDKNIYSAQFEEFWKVYPRKVGKKRAFELWNRRLKKESAETLILCAKHYAEECERKKTEERFIKHASTFLSDKLDYQDFLSKPEEKKIPFRVINGAKEVFRVTDEEGEWMDYVYKKQAERNGVTVNW